MKKKFKRSLSLLLACCLLLTLLPGLAFAVDEVGLEPASYGRFTGWSSVVNALTGEPIYGADVWLSYSFINEEGYEEWMNVHTTTCIDGFYEITFSMPLASPLTVWAPGFQATSPEIHVNRWWVMIDVAYLMPV